MKYDLATRLEYLELELASHSAVLESYNTCLKGKQANKQTNKQNKIRIVRCQGDRNRRSKRGKR